MTMTFAPDVLAAFHPYGDLDAGAREAYLGLFSDGIEGGGDLCEFFRISPGAGFAGICDRLASVITPEQALRMVGMLAGKPVTRLYWLLGRPEETPAVIGRVVTEAVIELIAQLDEFYMVGMPMDEAVDWHISHQVQFSNAYWQKHFRVPREEIIQWRSAGFTPAEMTQYREAIARYRIPCAPRNSHRKQFTKIPMARCFADCKEAGLTPLMLGSWMDAIVGVYPPAQGRPDYTMADLIAWALVQWEAGVTPEVGIGTFSPESVTGMAHEGWWPA